VRNLVFFAVGCGVVLYFLVVGLPKHSNDANNDLYSRAHGAEEARFHHEDSASRGRQTGDTQQSVLERLLGEERRKNDVVLTRLRKAMLGAVKNGVDFFADYDVGTVKIGPPPPLEPPRFKEYLFHYMDTRTSKYPFVWLSEKPRVAFVPEFITDEEADDIVRAAEAKMQRSQVALGLDANKGASNVDDVRTSSGAWLDVSDGNGTAGRIAARALDLIGFPAHSSEMLQVLRYKHGQKYDAHLDYFDPRRYGHQTSNRAVTIYFYLSDVEEGGETSFPMANGRTDSPTNFADCSRGLRVRPKKRAVAVFYDMDPLGRFDPSSLHGGCPVTQGVKWGAPLWVRVPVEGYPAPT